MVSGRQLGLLKIDPIEGCGPCGELLPCCIDLWAQFRHPYCEFWAEAFKSWLIIKIHMKYIKRGQLLLLQ